MAVKTCLTSDDCDAGDMCNMDLGEHGGFYEPCPGNTEIDCHDANFNQQLGTDECLNICVGQASEYSNDILLFISYYLKFWNGGLFYFPDNETISRFIHLYMLAGLFSNGSQ